MPLSSPTKTHGGKAYLASRIVGLMPPRHSPDHPDGWLHYVEPFFGGGAVLLANDPEGISEVVNDLNRDLANFWAVLRSWAAFTQLQQMLEATPFSEEVWQQAAQRLERPWESPCVPASLEDRLERAWAFLVHCRQSLAGRRQAFAPISRRRTRRGRNEQVSAWLSAIEGLPAVHARLKRVVVLNRDALDVIREQDGPQTLHYIDPPYLHETRATTTEYGPHEMSHGQHAALLNVLENVKGRFLLSGYRSDLYDAAALRNGWRRVDWDIANHAAGGGSKRRMVESLWVNYDPPEVPA